MMNPTKKILRVFLCGDVMTGRGIDQILSHPSNPKLYESLVKDARDYVYLAEEANGKIFYPVTMDYIWGDALAFWQQLDPDLKIINLETAITQSDDYWPNKGINYRMHPDNVNVLTTAGINICTLANNHILDWCYEGLSETLVTLKNSGIKFAGAGENIMQAMQPAIFECGLKKRVLVFSIGSASSGVPSKWEATSALSGIYYLPDTSQDSLADIINNVEQYKQSGDLIVFSIHWGSNWGYEINEAYRSFAHALIDDAKVDVIFGHSSHHFRPIEIYHGKPILYGCGDFINDYEGISGYEEYRSDLSFMYFLDFEVESLQLQKLTLIPLQIKNFSLHHATKNDCEWLLQILNQFATFDLKFTLHNRRFYSMIL